MEFNYQTAVFLALVAGIYSGPVDLRSLQTSSSSCAQTCTESSKFQYSPGLTYEFSYEVETKTAMYGASEDHATIRIAATADIEVVSKCEMTLKLRDISLKAFDSRQFRNQDEHRNFARTLEQHSLRFSFQDGQIDAVCPDEQETPWALNIKKGILSSFQNSMDNFDRDHSVTEDDVTGRCKSQYTVIQKGWLSLTIKKSKDLLSCTHRHGYETAIQATPFGISSSLKSLPLMKSTYTCDQEVATDGYLKSTLCHEIHTFRPFSKANSGATTEVTQTLTFVRHTAGISTAQGMIDRRDKLFFDHSQGEPPEERNIVDAQNKLKEICENTVEDIRPDTPQLFSSLVYIMKKMDFVSLKKIYSQVERSSLCTQNADRTKKFYMDAIPMVGTGSSVRLMRQLIQNNKVTGDQAEMWLASLALMHHPTKEILNEVKDLIQMPSLSTKVLLPLSTLVHTYCRSNPQCDSVAEVSAVISSMVDKIGAGCRVDDTNYRTVMMTLRAIGNAGHAQTATPVLDSCYGNSDNPMSVRVAAVEAYRRLSCGADRNNLMALYRNTDEDSELRITAYLAVMKCPNTYILSQVKESLASEEVNQVGSFVWSHLTNLMESSDPHTKDIRQILEDDILSKEFDMDKRKFSRNYEGSFFWEKLGTGAKVDSNLIWSTQSFIPRSAAVNLTFDLFGESINLFEFGGRVEGLEHLLESYFGPAGYFKDSAKNNDVDPMDNRASSISTAKLNRLHNKVERPMDELRGALYMRMFGNEMTYSMFGKNAGEDSQNFNMFDFLRRLRNGEQRDISFTKSSTFLDSTIIIPLAVGLPLNLTINGTASVDVQATGRVDMRNPALGVIEGNFQPSGSVEVASMMSVDAFATRGGLKMVSTLHTSSGARAKVEMTKNKVFSLEVDVTKDKSEIMDVKTAFFIMYRDAEREQRMIDNRMEKTACSGDMMQKITGLQICGEVQFPNSTAKHDAPAFPFTGPMGMSLVMYKRDLPNGYRLEAKTINTAQQTLFRLMSETPGSVQDRSVGVDVTVGHEDKTLDITLASPWTKLEFAGRLKDKETMKQLMGKLTIDSKRIYLVDGSVQVAKTETQWTFTPSLTINVPDWKNLELTGKLDYLKTQKLEADLNLRGLQDDPVVISGAILNTAKEVGARGQFSYKANEVYNMEAIVQKSILKKKKGTQMTLIPKLSVSTPTEDLVVGTGSFALVEGKSVSVNGRLEKLTKKPIIMDAQFTKINYTKRKRTKYGGKINLLGGGAITSKFMFNLDKKGTKTVFLKSKLDYNVGKGRKDTLLLNNKVVNRSNKLTKNYKVTTTFTSARFPDYKAQVESMFTHKPKLTSADIDLSYGRKWKDKDNKEKVSLSALATHKIAGSNVEINYTITIVHVDQDINAKLTGGYEHSRRMIGSDLRFRFQPGKVTELGFKLHNRTRDLPSYAGDFMMSLPSGKQMDLSATFEQNSLQKYTSSLEFEIQRGQRSRVQTMLKMVTGQSYEVEATLERPSLPRVFAAATFNKEPQGYSANGTFQKGARIYGASTSVMYIAGSAGKLALDFQIPDRHVILAIDGLVQDTRRRLMFDIQWDADNNVDDRFLFNVSTNLQSIDNFEILSALSYPSRTLGFNIKHTSGDRYITHIDLTWERDKTVEMDLLFRNEKKWYSRRVEATIDFSSPFQKFERLGFELSHIQDRAQYQSKSSVTWGRNKKVLVSSTIKRPITLESIDMAITVTTPFKRYQSMTGRLLHSYDDNLQSSVLVQWDRKRISLAVGGSKNDDGITKSMTGNIDLNTPFENFTSLVISFEHTKTGNAYSSKVTFNTDAGQYEFMLDASHLHDLAQLQHSGTLQINIPIDRITTNWKISHTVGNIYGLLDIMPSRGNRFKIMIDEKYQIFDVNHRLLPQRTLSSEFELLIPSETLRELQISFGHDEREGYMQSYLTITKDQLNAFALKSNYDRLPGRATYDCLIQSMYTDDVIIKMSSSHMVHPYIGHAEIQWKPFHKMALDSSYYYNEFGVFEASYQLTTPFERARQLILKTDRKRDGLNWLSTVELQYAPQQKIKVETHYRFDHVRLTSITLTTPFPQVQHLTTGFQLEGTLQNLRGEASFAMAPMIQRHSVSGSWTYYNGEVTGKVRIDTPHQHFPYARANIQSNMLGESRVSKLELEYLPTQIIKIDSNYRFTSLERLEGSITVESPFTENEVVARFTHTGNMRQFVTNANINCECLPRNVLIDAKFDSEPVVMGTFHMISPFRGYEVTKFNFTHRGKDIKDFHTEIEYDTNGKKIDIDTLLQITDTIKGRAAISTPLKGFRQFYIGFNHSGEFPNMQSYAEGALDDQVIETGLTLGHSQENTHGKVMLKTPFEQVREAHTTLAYSGTYPNINVHAEGSLNTKRTELDLVMENTAEKSMTSVSVSGMPFEEFRSAHHMTSYSGVYPNIQVHTESRVNSRETETDFTMSSIGSKSEASVTMATPYKHFRNARASFSLTNDFPSVQSHFEGEVNSQRMETDVNFTLRKSDAQGSLSMATPFDGYRTMAASFSHSGKFPNIHTQAEGSFDSQRVHTELNLTKNRRRTTGSVTFTSPFERLENLGGSFSHAGQFPNIHTEAGLSSGQKILHTELDLSKRIGSDDMTGSLTMTSPFEGYENGHVSFSRSGRLPDVTAHVEGALGTKKIETDLTMAHSKAKKLSTLSVTATTPFEGYEEMSFKVNKKGESLDFVTDAEVTYAKFKTIRGNLAFQMQEYNVYTKALFSMPYFEDDIILSFNQTGIPLSFVRIFDMSMGSDYSYYAKQAFHTREVQPWREIYVETTTKTVWAGEIQKAQYILDHNINYVEGINYDLKSKLHGYYNSKKFNLDASYDMTFKDQAKQVYDADMVIILELPHPDYVYSKYEQVRRMSSPYSYTQKTTVTLPIYNTPFSSSTTAEFINNRIRYEEVYTYPVDNTEKSFSYIISYDINTHTGDIIVKTPYEGYESIEVDFSKSGEISNMELNGVVRISRMSPMRGTIVIKYLGTMDFESTANFVSGIDGYENINAELKHKLQIVTDPAYDIDYEPYLQISWDGAQQVLVEGKWELKDTSASSGLMSSHLQLVTPAEALRQFQCTVSHTYSGTPLRAKDIILIQHNGETYFDVDAEVSVQEKFAGSLSMTQPRAMEYVFSGINEGESFEGNLLLNWNKDEPRSNLRLEFGLADKGDRRRIVKNFNLKSIHPDRTVGVTAILQKSSGQLLSSGELTWDQSAGKIVSYDLQLNGRAGHNYDYTLKMKVPTRDLELQGSLTDREPNRVIDTNFFWDAEQDRTRQVGATLTYAMGQVRKMAKVDLRMPVISKELSIKQEVAVNDGRDIFDGVTEISYSPDQTKTLTLHTKLEDISDVSAKNYTFSFGVTHPHSHTDIQISTTLGHSDSQCTQKCDFRYLTSQQERKNFALMGVIDRLRRQINIQVFSPTDSAGFSGHMTSESPYQLSMETVKNNVLTWRSELTVNTVDRSLDMSMNYNKDDLSNEIQTTANFPSETSFQSNTIRRTRSGDVSEGHMEASLNNSRVLHSRITWRPGMMRDMLNFGSEVMKQSAEGLNQILTDAIEALGNEVEAKYGVVSQNLSDDLQPLTDMVQREIGSLQEDMVAMRRELKRMYKRNELYLQDIEKGFDGAVITILSGYNTAIADIKVAYAQVAVKMEELCNSIEQYPIQERYNQLVDNRITEIIKEYQALVMTEIASLVEGIKNKRAELSAEINRLVEQVSAEMKQALNELLDDISLSPYMKELQEMLNEIIAEFPELPALGDLGFQALDHLHELILEHIKDAALREKYENLVTEVRDLINNQFDDLLQNEDVILLHETLREFYQQAVWAYKYWDVEKNLQNVMKNLYEYTVQRVKSEFKQLPTGLLDMYKSKVMTFDLDSGEIEFVLYLPIPMDNFEELLEFRWNKYIKQLNGLVKKYFPRREFCLWDPLYQFKPVSWNPMDWVPPFDTYATVSGNQHFLTFDGKHFDFVGLCNYVLAEDRVDRNFTIIQKFNGDPHQPQRDSLVVLTNGKTVELFQGYRMEVDGRPAEFPFFYDKLSIYRVGNTIHLDNGKGLTIASDFDREYHIIGLSGWYFGKTTGLLGTYNYEQYDEFTKPNGVIVEDPAQLASGWEVADTCRSSRNFAVIPVVTENAPDYEVCATVFKDSSSPLRPGFTKVPPEPYMKQCMVDVTTMTLCDLEALYIQVSEINGVSMRLPESCVQCSTHDDQLYQADETVIYNTQGDNPIQSSADTIFIVEEKRCNQNVAAKLRDTVWEIENTLSRNGLSGNRYAVIGYSGDDEYTHTMEGQLFNDARKFAMGAESLRFEDSTATSDPLKAILAALKLPFRTGVSKNIMLVSCQPCIGADKYVSQALKSELQYRGIVLHVLRQSGFVMVNNESPKMKIYGLDSDELFHPRKGRKGGSAIDALFNEIAIPADSCTSLALNTNGSLFDSAHFVDGNIRQQRAFVSAVAGRIGQTATPPECQQCRCVLDRNGAAVSICNRCEEEPVEIHTLPSLIHKALGTKDDFAKELTDYITGAYAE